MRALVNSTPLTMAGFRPFACSQSAPGWYSARPGTSEYSEENHKGTSCRRARTGAGTTRQISCSCRCKSGMAASTASGCRARSSSLRCTVQPSTVRVSYPSGLWGNNRTIFCPFSPAAVTGTSQNARAGTPLRPRHKFTGDPSQSRPDKYPITAASDPPANCSLIVCPSLRPARTGATSRPK